MRCVVIAVCWCAEAVSSGLFLCVLCHHCLASCLCLFYQRWAACPWSCLPEGACECALLNAALCCSQHTHGTAKCQDFKDRSFFVQHACHVPFECDCLACSIICAPPVVGMSSCSMQEPSFLLAQCRDLPACFDVDGECVEFIIELVPKLLLAVCQGGCCSPACQHSSCMAFFLFLVPSDTTAVLACLLSSKQPLLLYV